MALLPLRLHLISRICFFAIAVTQGFLLATYVVDHENEIKYLGLAAIIAVLLIYWCGTLCCDRLKYNLSTVWFLYTCFLVVMIGIIFGRMVIKDNKLREQEIATCLCKNANPTSSSPIKANQSDSFFDSKFLKITLCFTPGEMLLLLTSVTDESEILTELYLTTVLNLFDGVEMLEVLHEDVCDKIPRGWEIAVLVAASLFFFVSVLEVHQVKFDESNQDQPKPRKTTLKVNIAFQIILNLAFLVIRLVLWFAYDFDSAIFMAKNVISLVIMLVPVLEGCDFITTKTDSE